MAEGQGSVPGAILPSIASAAAQNGPAPSSGPVYRGVSRNEGGISRRSQNNVQPYSEINKIMKAGSSNKYDAKTNADGIVSMGIAENRLMHPDIVNHLNNKLHLTERMLTYGDGSVGSDRLRESLAHFLNDNFHPKTTIEKNHVTILAGVSAVIDSLSFCLCEEGDGILIGRPLYYGFMSDFINRAKVKPVLVDFDDEDPLSIEGVECYEKALEQSVVNGTPVRALMFCHPHNPLGQCYPTEVMEGLLKLCGKYSIHFISDEVYAKSIFPSEDCPNPPEFVSVLSLDLEKYIDPAFVHCLYGMSKDFCSNGLRAGAFISQHNPSVHAALRSVSKFAWVSSLSDQAWYSILNDKAFLTKYLKDLVTGLSRAYGQVTAFLKKHNIPYSPAYCGPFIWICLPVHQEEPGIAGERKLAWKMLENKVWLATGEAYRAEIFGWWRMTFAVPSEELDEGLIRLARALELPEL